MLPFDAMGSLDRVLEFAGQTNEVARAPRGRRHRPLLPQPPCGVRAVRRPDHARRHRRDARPTSGSSSTCTGSTAGASTRSERSPSTPVASAWCTSRTTGSARCRSPRSSGSPPGTSPASWRAFSGLVQFAEVGQGTLDWPAIVDQAVASGAEYLLRRAGRHLRARPVRVARHVPRPPGSTRLRRPLLTGRPRRPGPRRPALPGPVSRGMVDGMTSTADPVTAPGPRSADVAQIGGPDTVLTRTRSARFVADSLAGTRTSTAAASAW